jgi:hypothetical protein
VKVTGPDLPPLTARCVGRHSDLRHVGKSEQDGDALMILDVCLGCGHLNLTVYSDDRDNEVEHFRVRLFDYAPVAFVQWWEQGRTDISPTPVAPESPPEAT